MYFKITIQVNLLLHGNFVIRYPEIVDSIIEKTLKPEAYVSNELSSHDIFYREVSTVHRFIPNLVNSAVEVTQTERPAQQISQYLMQVNTILLV